MSDESPPSGLYDSLPCAVMRLDGQLKVLFINAFALQLLAYERPDALLGKPLRSLLAAGSPGDAELDALRDELAIPGSRTQFVVELLAGDGRRVSLCLGVEMRADPAEPMAPFLCFGLDVTRLVQGRVPDALFRTVVTNYGNSIVITDQNQSILYANPAALKISGYTEAELLGRTPAIFASGKMPAEVYRQLWQTLDAGNVWRGEFVNRRKTGEPFRQRMTIAAIRDAAGVVQHYLATGEDDAEQDQYQQQIAYLTSFDQLTGLPNRAAYLQALATMLETARHGGHELAVLHVDLDDFFMVVATLGAEDSDSVLAQAGARLKDALRQVDMVARLGNDKFAILLGPHEAAIEADIREVSERVLGAMRQPFALAGSSIEITASLGIACYPGDGDSADELLMRAMSATAKAKREGGNEACRFEAAMVLVDSGRRELLVDLRKATERGEMILHFQPQVSLFSGSIIGLEALIRWQHPVRGMIPPGEFIPLAEESSNIIGIGEWVLAETCRQMRAWLDAGLPPVKVAINLAARHFREAKLHTTIADALGTHHLDPRLLEIEITEGAMMHDVAAAIRTTGRLKEIGVRISLDDFGTGYSSLAYLSRFPIDVVKIDQSFVRDITTNPANAAIAQATIAMSHKLGKIVLAEGVESEEQMQYLRRNECDEMQGYFFSRPRPAGEIARLLQEGVRMALSGQHVDETRNTILLVDDEYNILSALKRTMRREGYDIFTAQSAAEGFSLLARNRIQLIISDQRMPEMNGTEFLSRVKNLYPETVRMVLSGYSEISAVTDAINKGAVYRFLLKPWDDDHLKEEIRGAMRHWRELFGGDRP